MCGTMTLEYRENAVFQHSYLPKHHADGNCDDTATTEIKVSYTLGTKNAAYGTRKLTAR